ncbi:MAG: CoA protein activase, partial [Candidatus Krumholzibacteriota bacterium]|nr:CoA protein activase [Candidatus Krumholzibacteriota bacterium]
MVPQGDELTYELAGRHTSGDECLPARVTLGNFLKVTERPGFDPAKTAFFMPTAGGPCRFGQYAPFTERVLEEMGMEEAIVISPTSANGYGGLGRMAGPLLKLGWWGLVMSDALRKLLHLYRPHETEAGAADLAHEDSLDIVYEAIADRTVPMSRKLGRGIEAMEACRDRFRRVPVDFGHETMLVGVVGEIFCR